MRHSYYGKKLSRTKNERRRLFQGLARDMILYGKITTTVAKAKAVQPLIEKLITNAKKGTNAGVNEVRKELADKKSVDAYLKDAKTRFATRTSGYTRIIKLGVLRSDASHMATLSFVDKRVETEIIAPNKEKKIGKIDKKNNEKTKKKIIAKKPAVKKTKTAKK
jgi:large subunit ribosomal protein L17